MSGTENSLFKSPCTSIVVTNSFPSCPTLIPNAQSEVHKKAYVVLGASCLCIIASYSHDRKETGKGRGGREWDDRSGVPCQTDLHTPKGREKRCKWKNVDGRHGCGGDAGWDIRGGTGRCCKPRVQIIYV